MVGDWIHTAPLIAGLLGSVELGSQREVVNAARSTAALPFRAGIRTGEFLYLSGAVGTDPVTRALADGPAAQTERTLDNLGRVLQSSLMGPDYLIEIMLSLQR